MARMTDPATQTERPAADGLWARYRSSGDPAALGAFFDATAPTLFRIAASLVADVNSAEDALQETFIAALEHADRHDAARPILPWLVGILRVMVKRSRRDVARVPDPARLAAVQAAAAADHLGGESEDTLAMRRAIEALDEPYRGVALLRWRYGLSPAEIADVRGEPPGTSRSLLSRALARLRETLRGAPAFFLLPPPPRGLASVRESVLQHAASAVGATALAATAGLSFLAKVGIAAGVVALVGTGFVLRARARDGSDSASGGPVVEAPPEANGAGTSSPSSPPPEPALAAKEQPPAPLDPPPAPPSDAPVVATEPPPPPETPRPPFEPPLDEPAMVDTPPSRPPAKESVPRLVPPIPPSPPVIQPEAGADDDGIDVPLAEMINSAIDRGVAWLKGAQRPDGSWGSIEGNGTYGGGEVPAGGVAYGHPAGPAALALYALLKSGVPIDDPVVRRGFAFLRSGRQKGIPQGAYEISATLLAVTATADPFRRSKPGEAAPESAKFPAGDWRKWAERLQKALVEKRERAKTLGWRYMVPDTMPAAGGAEDLSSTQLAALALLSAERCGIKTDSRIWNDLITLAMKHQEADGQLRPRAVASVTTDGPKMDRARGFSYLVGKNLPPDEGNPTGGMTACGIATIQMARYVLVGRKDKTYAARDAVAIQESIYDGLAWIDRNWSPFENPGKKHRNIYHVYYVYCAERAFDLLGNKKLGPRFWYLEMAKQLLGRQERKGFWDSKSGHEPGAVLDTSFALLFLRRATRGEIPFPSLTDPTDTPGKDGR